MPGPGRKTHAAARLQEEHGRTLTLFDGMIMVLLVMVIPFDPTIMEQLLGSIVVMVVAVIANPGATPTPVSPR